MKKPITAFLVCTLLGIGAATAQISMPQPGAPGSSPDSAVRIIATSDLMVDRYIKRWLRTHYPGWDADPHEFTEFGPERYAVVYVTKKDNPGRRVYFRIKSRLNDPNDDQDGAFPF
jgi:hypothetical protein